MFMQKIFIAFLLLNTSINLLYADRTAQELERTISYALKKNKANNEKVLQAYDKAIKSYTRKGELEKALLIKSQMEAFEVHLKSNDFNANKNNYTKVIITTLTGSNEWDDSGNIDLYLSFNTPNNDIKLLKNNSKNNFKLGNKAQFEIQSKTPVEEIKSVIIKVQGHDAWTLKELGLQFFKGNLRSEKYTLKINKKFSSENADIKNGSISSASFKIKPRLDKLVLDP
jgi:hypothetical protein